MSKRMSFRVKMSGEKGRLVVKGLGRYKTVVFPSVLLVKFSHDSKQC